MKRCQVEPSNRDGLDELIGAWALDKFNWFIQAWEIFFVTQTEWARVKGQWVERCFHTWSMHIDRSIKHYLYLEY